MNVLTTGKRFSNRTIVEEIRTSDDGCLVTIPYNTEQTHQGRFFFTNYYNATIANGATIELLVTTGSATTPHIATMIDTGAASTLSIYEGVSTSSDGTSLTCFNANRLSANVTTASAFHTPTITDTGTTLLLNHYIPGSTGGSGGSARIGGSSTDFARITELVLKASTKYLFRVTNVSGGTIAGSIQLGWFEDV